MTKICKQAVSLEWKGRETIASMTCNWADYGDLDLLSQFLLKATSCSKENTLLF